ncbi:MAG: hypothetical protein LAT78_04460 [Roseinatronobacter sp.]|nr:hypothetical protein [Roseinatronobacter sp.]
MTARQTQFALEPGESPRALIAQSRHVQLLLDALTGVIGLMVAALALIWANIPLGQVLAGLGSGLLGTFVFLFGPLLLQRAFGAHSPYLLTNRRLILAPDDIIELKHIRRMRVWLTSISLHTDARKVTLRHLVNAPAVAALIRDTIAGEGNQR